MRLPARSSASRREARASERVEVARGPVLGQEQAAAVESGEGGGVEHASHDAGHYARPSERVAIDPCWRIRAWPSSSRRPSRTCCGGCCGSAEHERKVFDLPARRFWRGSPDLDLSVVVHGHRAANPVGPAAGPHGQMAQNVLLSWLAGGRFIELKTVQVNDRLTIPRPCIDMETVGYNVEWSQELRLAESLREYVKGSMLIDVARAAGLLGTTRRPRAGRHDPRPEPGLRPRRGPLARGAVLGRVDEGRAGRGRGPARRDPGRAPPAPRPRFPHERSPTRSRSPPSTAARRARSRRCPSS